jgi:hypothetical protein
MSELRCRIDFYALCITLSQMPFKRKVWTGVALDVGVEKSIYAIEVGPQTLDDFPRCSLRRLLPLLLRPRALPCQHRLQEPPGITPRDLDDIFRRAFGDDLAAAVAAFGAEID